MKRLLLIICPFPLATLLLSFVLLIELTTTPSSANALIQGMGFVVVSALVPLSLVLQLCVGLPMIRRLDRERASNGRFFRKGLLAGGCTYGPVPLLAGICGAPMDSSILGFFVCQFSVACCYAVNGVASEYYSS